MTDGSDPEPDPLSRVLALTPVGRQELRDPQSGLSLPQRWLLGHLDGESSLGELAALPGSPAADRLPRDAAKLASLGLALDMGEPGPSASSFGPSTLYGDITLSLPLDESTPPPARPMPAPASGPRRSVWLAAAAVGVVGAGAAWVASRSADTPAGPLAAASAVAPARAAPGASPVVAPPKTGAASAPPPGAALAVAAAAVASSPVPAGPASTASVAPALAPPMTADRPSQATQAALVPPAARPALATVPRLAAAEPAAPRGALPAPGRLPAAAPGLGDGTARSSPSPTPATVPTPYVPAAPAPSTVAVVASPLPQVAPAPSPAPPATAVPAPAPAVAAPAPPAIAPSAPAPAPAVAAALAPPVPAPAVPAVLRPVAQVEPAFPREGQGIGPGGVVLQARLVVAPNGTVSQVSFVQSSAATRVFERAARSALLQWRYPAGAGERVVMQSLRFSEE